MLIFFALVTAGTATVFVFFLIAVVASLFSLDDFHTTIAICIVAITRTPRVLAKAIVFCGFAAVPLLGTLVFFEFAKLRSWRWYAIAIVAFVAAANVVYVWLFHRHAPPELLVPPLFQPGVPLAILSILSALAGSTVYWLIAGRTAGGTRQLQSAAYR